MTGSPFDPPYDELPAVMPIFPLTGVLLLPRGRLPLNIFEPRYLAMVSDAMTHPRLIGMVQPREGRGDAGDPPVYSIGCAGRITGFGELDDGRYEITLTGTARFAIVEELAQVKGYRPVRVDWSRFRGDLEIASGGVDRDRLLAALKPYLKRHKVKTDWDAITKTPDERLVTSLAMVCPFAPSEKQGLLEAEGLPARARLLTALLEMAATTATERADVRH
ncbi:MAG TPA: LON peptidase substrate-binding domain-containing protein [Stellaceae bacterium]|nr:LON peptidase substrate-binding domain-containing protein [Stellaceae bacterium]